MERRGENSREVLDIPEEAAYFEVGRITLGGNLRRSLGLFRVYTIELHILLKNGIPINSVCINHLLQKLSYYE